MTTNSVTVQLRDSNTPLNPAAPPTVQINGKTYRITRLRIRDHVQQDWRNIDVNQCPYLNSIAQTCSTLFTQLKPTDEADLKKVSFTFELGNSGFLGRDKNSTLQLKKIDYMDPNSKTQTVEVNLEKYSPTAQQTLKQIIDPLWMITRIIFASNRPKQEELHSPQTISTPIDLDDSQWVNPDLTNTTSDANAHSRNGPTIEEVDDD